MGLDEQQPAQERFALTDVARAFLIRREPTGIAIGSRAAAAAQSIATMTDAEVRELLVPTRFRDQVEIDPGRNDGSPVLRGTRISTFLFRNCDPVKVKAHLREMPFLTDTHAQAAVDFERLLDEAAC